MKKGDCVVAWDVSFRSYVDPPISCSGFPHLIGQPQSGNAPSRKRRNGFQSQLSNSSQRHSGPSKSRRRDPYWFQSNSPSWAYSFKIYAPYLHVSGVLKELINSDAEDASPTFVSDDGVVLPLNFAPINNRFHSLENHLKTSTFSWNGLREKVGISHNLTPSEYAVSQ
jgi:hypothetical protein